ncbi:MAG: ribosomal protein S18-alanine N-acetyltransferase [Candidatus Thorarchaeota archaeon]|nr:MAG: ribosomal protein S18-alanine N-acetyltransferase [Candidatus Thorarchaeota archaeon]
MSYEVRQFEPSDINSVVTINRTCLPENYPEQFFMGLHYHAPKAFLVATIEESVIGYIMCRIERGISNYGRLPVKKGHIVSVAVMPELREQGIGTKLIVTALEEMSNYGATEYFLEVRKSNSEAVSVYETLCFDIKKVLRGYYRDGEDAYLMSKKGSEEVEDSAIE